MKQSIIILLLTLMLGACSNKDTAPQQWEYNIVSFPGSKLPTVYSPNDEKALIELSNSQTLHFPEASSIPNSLNLYGKEGWELVSVYTTTETVFPILVIPVIILESKKTLGLIRLILYSSVLNKKIDKEKCTGQFTRCISLQLRECRSCFWRNKRHLLESIQ